MRDRIRPNDIVLHKPSGEKWVVAGVNYDEGRLIEPVRRGRWEKENSRAKSYLRLCSACGKTAYFCGIGCSYNFCPNCGAKMDGGKQDAD